MTYRKRLISLILLDSLIVRTAIFIATWIVYPLTTGFNMRIVFISAIALLLFHHLFAALYKLYHKVWAYASIGELLAIFQAVTFSIVLTGLVQFFINDFSVYKRSLIVIWMLHILFIGGSRFIWRMYRDHYMEKRRNQRRTLIVGAGAAGAMIARQLASGENNANLKIVGFVDDNPNKHKMHIYNIPVLGKVADIGQFVKQKKAELIVIAIPSLSNRELRTIIDKCTKTEAHVQMIPKLEDLMTGKVSVNHLKNVDVEDLLGRDPVKLDIAAIKQDVVGQTVMVTGAGGSIGSELCRQLASFQPKQIILLGHGEHSIYMINRELRRTYGKTITFTPVIGDVQDRERMFEVVETYEPTVIYHAAAHKHVPLMEANPHEAVKNNIIGTKNIAEAADFNGVKTFVFVSTDKAVNPTNVMGATKRIAEMIIQSLNDHSQTTFTAVRFGNVLGSRGSVIPTFREQIRQGGPVTVTDPRMTRYFMTIPEASRLVIQASTLAKGGEVFVLDMGEPVKILDLAKNLIKLSGYREEEIEIKYTGIRPGEKMYEELLNKDEIHPNAVYEKIYVGKTTDVDERDFELLIETFEQHSKETLKEALMEIVYEKRKLISV